MAKFWLDPVVLARSSGFSRSELRIVESVEKAWYELATRVTITDDTLSVDLLDGRTVSVPLEWYPRLVHAQQSERENCRFTGNGEGIHWPDLDEDISIEAIVFESLRSRLERHDR